MTGQFREGRWVVRALTLVGVAFAVDAALKAVNQPEPTVGLFRGITDLAIAVFGPSGVAANSALASLACFYLARSAWRSTSRKPTERLWW